MGRFWSVHPLQIFSQTLKALKQLRLLRDEMTFSNLLELICFIEKHLKGKKESYCFFFERGIEHFQTKEKMTQLQKDIIGTGHFSEKINTEENYCDYNSSHKEELKLTVGWGKCSTEKTLDFKTQEGFVITPSFLSDDDLKPIFLQCDSLLEIKIISSDLCTVELAGNVSEFGLKSGRLCFSEAISNELQKEKRLKPTQIGFDERAYIKKVKEIQSEILKGNAYLLNLTHRFNFNSKDCPSFKEFLWTALKKVKSRFSIYFKGPSLSFISYTPECFLKVLDKVIVTEPIKGTAIWDDAGSHQKGLWGSMKESSKRFRTTTA